MGSLVPVDRLPAAGGALCVPRHIAHPILGALLVLLLLLPGCAREEGPQTEVRPLLTVEPSPTVTTPTPTAPSPAAPAPLTATPEQLLFDEADPRFAPGACPFSWSADRPVRCGYLTLPLDRDARAETTTIRLPVAIFASDVSPPAPDPVLFLYGERFPEPVLERGAIYVLDRLRPLLAERELILVDVRGTGLGEPALTCPEVNMFLADPASETLAAAAWYAGWQAAQAACRQRLQEAGWDPVHFDWPAAAADVADLRDALGYPQINLVAVGAGGRAAVAAMGEPAGIRAVILDSPLPPDALSPVTRSAALRRALIQLAEACAAQPTCAAAYPELVAGDGDAVSAVGPTKAEPAASAAPAGPPPPAGIERQLADVLVRLETEPLLVTLPRSGDPVPVDGRRLLELLEDSFSYPPALPYLPQLLHELTAGETALLGALLESVPRTAPVPTAAAGVCEGWQDAAAEDAGDDPLDLVARAAGAGLAALCGERAVVLPAPASDVPLLILNGTYDPISDPAWGAAIAARSAVHFQVTLPGLGFGVLQGDRCAGRLAAAFLSAPGSAPAAACVENLLIPPFTTP